MIKAFARMLRRKISPRIYRILRIGPLIVPKYYQSIISDIEDKIDAQREHFSIDDEEMATLLLRKQAHIIDKGLQRKDFKPGHSQASYHCALDEIRKISSKELLEDSSVVWGELKIKEYEEKQQNPNLEINSKSNELLEIPTPEHLYNLITTRRSVRYFQEKKVSSELLRECINVINWGPSSCNKQPIQVYTTNDPTYAIECAKNCKGFTGFNSYIPCFMAICIDTRGYVLPSEMYLPAIDASLGAQNMILMMHANGLSSTVLSWAQKSVQEEQRLRKLLDIPDYCEIIFNLVAGYPDIIPPTPERKSVQLTMYLKER